MARKSTARQSVRSAHRTPANLPIPAATGESADDAGDTAASAEATRYARPPVVTVQSSVCPRCGSTARTDYHHTHVQPIAGQLPDGRFYTRVVWRRTECKACGQSRIDKSFEASPARSPEA